MRAKLGCKHCAGQFRPLRQGHVFCSDTCRKLAFKAKKKLESKKKFSKRLETKLKALSASVFGGYLYRELVRAGTVQVLSGHTHQSLAELVTLRRKCTSAGGYLKGLPIGDYELSHIYPVSGKSRIGLLHPSNLVICPKSFNRKHSRTVPKEGSQGASIPRDELLKKWRVEKSFTVSAVLNLARKFIGSEFDKWLNSHRISVSQSKALIKKLTADGTVTKEYLQGMTLEQLRLLADEAELPYFQLDKSPDDLLWVVTDEMTRLLPESSMTELTQRLCESWDSLEGFDASVFGGHEGARQFKDFLSNQCLLMLHGLPYEGSWRSKSFSDYVMPPVHQTFLREVRIDDDYDDIL